jgi:hypothetical protein
MPAQTDVARVADPSLRQPPHNPRIADPDIMKGCECVMRASYWIVLGAIGGAVLGVGYLLIFEDGRSTVGRAVDAGGRVRDGVVDLAAQISDGVERVAGVVGDSLQVSSDEARAQAANVRSSAVRAVQDVGRALAPRSGPA